MNLASDPRTRECNGTATCRAELHLQGCLTYRTATHDVVNHPSHYGGGNDPYEAIKVIEAWGLNFHLGNAAKYIRRADLKNDAVEDLKKAEFYIRREIQRRERA